MKKLMLFPLLLLLALRADSQYMPSPVMVDEPPEIYRYASSFYMPEIVKIYDEAFMCFSLEDDKTLYRKFKVLVERNDRFDLEPWRGSGPKDPMLAMEGAYRPGKQQIDQFMLQSKGHIFKDAANPETIRAFAEIWRENPCSHAGVGALLQIANLVGVPPLSLEGEYPGSSSRDQRAFCAFIALYNPGSWEELVATFRYHMLFSPVDRVAWMENSKSFTNIFERENLASDKYYRLYDDDLTGYMLIRNQIEYYYMDQCKDIATNDIATSGKISPKAIEMYEQHFYWANRHRKIGYRFSEWQHLIPCYELIKKYAPDRYHGDPSLTATDEIQEIKPLPPIRED